MKYYITGTSLLFESRCHSYRLSCSSADFLSIGVCMWACVCVSPSSSFCFCLCCRVWISLSSCKAARNIGRNSDEEELGSQGWLLRFTTDNNHKGQEQRRELVRRSRQAPPLQICHLNPPGVAVMGYKCNTIKMYVFNATCSTRL